MNGSFPRPSLLPSSTPPLLPLPPRPPAIPSENSALPWSITPAIPVILNNLPAARASLLGNPSSSSVPRGPVSTVGVQGPKKTFLETIQKDARAPTSFLDSVAGDSPRIVSSKTSQALYEVTKLVGTPLRMAQGTAQKTVLNKAKVCVEVDASIPPPTSLWIVVGGKDHEVLVEYDDYPDFCGHCNKLGHTEEFCFYKHPELKPQGKHIPANQVPISVGEAEGEGFVLVQNRNQQKKKKATIDVYGRPINLRRDNHFSKKAPASFSESIPAEVATEPIFPANPLVTIEEESDTEVIFEEQALLNNSFRALQEEELGYEVDGHLSRVPELNSQHSNYLERLNCSNDSIVQETPPCLQGSELIGTSVIREHGRAQVNVEPGELHHCGSFPLEQVNLNNAE